MRPKPKVPVYGRIQEGVKTLLDDLSRQQHRSASQIIELALIAYIDRYYEAPSSIPGITVGDGYTEHADIGEALYSGSKVTKADEEAGS